MSSWSGRGSPAARSRRRSRGRGAACSCSTACRFPSDQLSTHVLLPAGTSELARLGALPRILALNPSRVRWVVVEVDGVVCRERLRPRR